MPSPEEWGKAIRRGPAAKRKLLAKDIKDKRNRSELSPEKTERILALYEKYSLENFEISERQSLTDNEEDVISGWFIFFCAVVVPIGTVLGYLIVWIIFH